MTREVIRIIAIDQPICARRYGDAFGSPVGGCTAQLGVTGDRKCFNTRSTCQDSENYDPQTPLMLLFAEPQPDLARHYDNVIPSLISVDTAPGTINLGGMTKSMSALGTREEVTLMFSDHRHSDLLVDPYRLERRTGQAATSAGEVDFAFARDISIVAAHGSELASITFTRTSATATRVNAQGLIETVAADTPRFDYDPFTLECKGLLIEEARTNLCLQSADFATTWTVLSTGDTVSANATDAPDGLTSADKTVEGTHNGNHGVTQSLSKAASAIQYTFSIWLKAAGIEHVQIFVGDGASAQCYVRAHLASGTIDGQVSTGGWITHGASIESYPNGWYRCSSIFTTGTETTLVIKIVHSLLQSGLEFYTGDGSSGLYLWGAQLEQGHVQTSYIPTTTANVTRNADAARVSDISAFFNADEGSVFIEATYDRRANASTQFPWTYEFDDGTGTDEFGTYVSQQNGGVFFLVRDSGGATQAQIAMTGAISQSGGPVTFLAANAYQQDNFATCKDGGTVGTDTGGTVPACTQLRIGQGDAYFNGHIRRLTYFPSRLSNTVLQRLSAGTTAPESLFTNAYDPSDRGTFWGKWLARNPFHASYQLRIYEGYLGDALEDMRVRHYLIDSIDGPTDGEAKLVAKDIFSFIDKEKAVAPEASLGELAADITDVAGSFAVTPTGIGSEYPASGYVAIGDEIIQFTRSGDTFTAVTRGALNTTADSHKDEDLVQLVLSYSSRLAVDIVYDLLCTYTSLGSSGSPTESPYINKAAWDAASTSLTALYTATIAKPEAVVDLISELAEQAGFALVPNIATGMIDWKSTRAGASAVTFDDDDIVADSFSKKEMIAERVSQVWVYYAQISPVENLNEKKNYRSRLVEVDADAESDVEYGVPSIREVFSRWIPQFGRSLASSVALRLVAMFRDAPFEAKFKLHASREDELALARLVNLEVAEVQDETGAVATVQHAIIGIERDEHEIAVTARSIVFADTSETGGGEAGGGERVIYIENDSYNLNLRTIHDTLYAAPAVQSPSLVVRFIVVSGIVVGSTSTSNAAMATGSWPSGVNLILENRGRIQGKGGAGGTGGVHGLSQTDGSTGGDALEVSSALIVDNSNGQIWSGGGGGGGGADGTSGGIDTTGGGGGGGGAGTDGGAGGSSANIVHPGSAGSAGTDSAGGSGGAGAGGSVIAATAGGDGGGPGLSGSNASSNGGGAGGSGGLAGYYVNGNSLVSWGSPTGDLRGRVN